MKKVMIGLALVGYVSAFLGLVSCSEKQEIEKTHDWTYEPIEVVVHVYPSEKEVTESYWLLHEEKYGKVTDDFERYGWAGWNEESNYCEIHTVDVKNKNDKAAIETLGHEMVHCLYGSWHSEVNK